jgi:putative tricarboxylic transport membrane protein
VPGIVEMCVTPRVDTSKMGTRSSARQLLRGLGAPFRHPVTAITSSLVGLWIGILPAVGGSVGALLAYNLNRTRSPNGAKFGTGDGEEEGIVACETANGSDEGGSLATLFTLGMPGSATTAAMMGALMLHGWAVGPKMVFDHWEIIQAVVWAELLPALLLVPIGLVFCYYARQIVKVKPAVLAPMIGAIMVTGIFALRGEATDVAVAVAFGIVAWLMAKTDFPPINFIVGLLLGPVLEGELVRMYATFRGRWELLLQRPIFLVLLVVLAAILFFTVRGEVRKFRRERAATTPSPSP